MSVVLPKQATQPTFYFVGVTTGKSSIMKVFPRWAKEVFALEEAVIKGIDMELNSQPEDYRAVVEFMKNDPLSMGALVTTHKLDLYEACEDLFDYLDPHARHFRELSCISKRNGQIRGHAKDPISSGLAMEAFVPSGFWEENCGEVFIMGAGGAALAISSYLAKSEFKDNVPSRILISECDELRLAHAKEKLKELNPKVEIEYALASSNGGNDGFIKTVKPYSLIVNATGMGKDRPGSPLSGLAAFPSHSLAWELNYRGDLVFVEQAMSQKEEKEMKVEDGWIYFIHGWTQVIAEVFDIEITESMLDECSRIAKEVR